jgi:hypothetical protein
MRKSGWIVCIAVSMVLALSALPAAQKSVAGPPPPMSRSIISVSRRQLSP